jgi:hypothetical protein
VHPTVGWQTEKAVELTATGRTARKPVAKTVARKATEAAVSALAATQATTTKAVAAQTACLASAIESSGTTDSAKATCSANSS